jgi:hypothetical protein
LLARADARRMLAEAGGDPEVAERNVRTGA